MVQRQQHVPKSIYTLANDLDAILAATEDFLTLRPDAHPGTRLRIELIAITHVLQARQRIRELRFADSRLAAQAVLFLAGTAILESHEFKKAEPSSSPDSNPHLIGGRTPSEHLANVAGGMLDALEYCFPLYEIDDGEEVIIPASSGSASEPAIILREKT